MSDVFNESRCPSCGAEAERTAYDVGSGPELSCANCEWCWGALGQPLQHLSLEGMRRALDNRPEPS